MTDILTSPFRGRQLVPKVMIYILDEDLESFLVFSQPAYPDAGIQVPAGTIEENEAPECAAPRELAEETGLFFDSRLTCFAVSSYDMASFKNEAHLRYWFVGVNDGTFDSDGWTHVEERGGNLSDLTCSFSWRLIDDGRRLIAGHGHLVEAARHYVRSEITSHE